MYELGAYINEAGEKRFARRFEELDAVAAAKVTIALTRMERGNLSNLKGGRCWRLEYKIDFGPGYRIYFGKNADSLVILIGGGTKKRQDRDIAAAQECWADYKRRKKHATYA